MWHIGIDLHREFVVMAAVNDAGEAMDPVRISCQEREAIVDWIRALVPLRAVVEASGTYRWLYDMLRPHGSILLAHPLRLRAMIQRRSKTDKLDAQLLANLLRIHQIPLAYIPPEPYQQLRELTRCRARLGRDQAQAKIKLRALLARQNRQAPFRVPFGVRGLAWFRQQDFGPIENLVRDELLERLSHFRRQSGILDEHLAQTCPKFPQVEALTDIHGIGLFSALLIVAELGEVERFRTAKQVGAYAGLTSRVHQSGSHCYRGSITRQGSPWLRWIFVEAALKVIRGEDAALRNFYTRVRKRSSAKIAHVAVARKLAEICWKRLRHWQRERASHAA
jgi:transposase